MENLFWKFEIKTRNGEEIFEVVAETKREALLELCRALGIGGCETYARACLRKYYGVKLLSYKFSPRESEQVISFQ